MRDSTQASLSRSRHSSEWHVYSPDTHQPLYDTIFYVREYVTHFDGLRLSLLLSLYVALSVSSVPSLCDTADDACQNK